MSHRGHAMTPGRNPHRRWVWSSPASWLCAGRSCTWKMGITHHGPGEKMGCVRPPPRSTITMPPNGPGFIQTNTQPHVMRQQQIPQCSQLKHAGGLAGWTGRQSPPSRGDACLWLSRAHWGSNPSSAIYQSRDTRSWAGLAGISSSVGRDGTGHSEQRCEDPGRKPI